MAIEKMMRVRLRGGNSVLNKTLLRTVQVGCFHPESEQGKSAEHNAPVNHYAPLLTQLRELLTNLYPAEKADAIERAAFSGDHVYHIGTLPPAALEQLQAPGEQVFALEPLGEAGDGQPVWCGLQVPLAMDATITKQLHAMGYNDHTAQHTALITRLSERVTAVRARVAQCAAALEEIQQTQAHLDHLQAFDVSFDDLFACTYLKVRFGRMPAASYRRLNDDLPYLFYAFDVNRQDCWCLYVVPWEEAEAVDRYLADVHSFVRVRIPRTAHGTVAQVEQELKRQAQQNNEEMQRLRAELEELRAAYRRHLEYLVHVLLEKSVAFSLYQYETDTVQPDGAPGFSLMGFVPARSMPTLEKALVGLPVTLEAVPANREKRLPVPVTLRNRRLFQPFEMFIDMYGLPDYHGFDPTPIVAGLYTLLFGMMFGDVGQGLCMALLGFVVSRRKPGALWRVMTRIGLSSALFGFVYGSVFGFEHWLDPLYRRLGVPFLPFNAMQPQNMNAVLVYAIVLGAGVIVLGMCLHIVTQLRLRRWARAVFSNNGVAGLVLYGGILYIAAGQFLGWAMPFALKTLIALLGIPLLCIFFAGPICRLLERKPKIFEEGVGGFFLETFFEMFEVLLSLFSNTLSFLRVGAFVLSHVGMMAVVMMLAQQGSGLSPPVVVIGNLFVMGMEGLIVGIQVLRLTFYEFFSRFYGGGGRPWVPLRPTVSTADARGASR